VQIINVDLFPETAGKPDGNKLISTICQAQNAREDLIALMRDDTQLTFSSGIQKQQCAREREHEERTGGLNLIWTHSSLEKSFVPRPLSWTISTLASLIAIHCETASSGNKYGLNRFAVGILVMANFFSGYD
jgi:hypothetical protein